MSKSNYEILNVPVPIPTGLISEQNRKLIEDYFAVEIDKAREQLPAFLSKQEEIQRYNRGEKR